MTNALNLSKTFHHPRKEYYKLKACKFYFRTVLIVLIAMLVPAALVMAGGVSANTRLRAAVARMSGELGGRAYYPRPALCTDNGAMIAYAGWQRLRAGQHEQLEFSIRPRWPMVELPPV